MKKRFIRILVICLSAMIVFGGLSCAYATINIEVGAGESAATKVEVINSNGECVHAWMIEEKGPLVKELEAGTYTLREVIEINGYEIPVMPTWNAMLGYAVIVPADSLDPEFPTPSIVPPIPEDLYDDFWEWIDTL